MSIKFLRSRADKLRALRSRFMHYGKMARSVMGNKLNTALIILLLATAPALALSPDAPPPPKYDHPFNGVVRVDHDVAACIKMRPLVPGEIRLGCTDWRKTADAEGLCVVHMLPDKELKRYGFSRERLLRHHIGHCNGWPDDHSSHPMSRHRQNTTIRLMASCGSIATCTTATRTSDQKKRG